MKKKYQIQRFENLLLVQAFIGKQSLLSIMAHIHLKREGVKMKTRDKLKLNKMIFFIFHNINSKAMLIKLQHL